MPKAVLTPDFVLHPPACPRHRIKTDYFDTEIPGFLLEVRRSGKATFYQRYRDAYGRMRQCRIGPTDCISLEEARKRALRIRAGVLMGVDPLKEVEKRRRACAFKDFVREQYLPFARIHKRSWQLDRQMLENRVLPAWGSKMMDEVGREDVEAFKADLVQKGFRASSVNRYLALVKYVFNLAERWKVISESPGRNVSKLGEGPVKERYLSQEETRNLLTALKRCQSPVRAALPWCNTSSRILEPVSRSSIFITPGTESDVMRGFQMSEYTT